jgi:hypothetical protein
MSDEIKRLTELAEKQRQICDHDQKLYLRRYGAGQWALYGPAGNQISCVFSCGSLVDAEIQAKAWASSWSGMIIVVEDK